jgi:hypothetical protein
MPRERPTPPPEASQSREARERCQPITGGEEAVSANSRRGQLCHLSSANRRRGWSGVI